MKHIGKVILVLLTALLLTGCSKSDLKKSYNNMEVGESDKQVNGYTLSVRLFGIYEDKKITQSIKVDNYMNEDFKVTTSTDEENSYYLIGKDGYKSVLEEDKEESYNKYANFSTILSYEKITDEVPFTDTNIYLTSLKSARKIEKPVSESIGETEYTTYKYVTSKKVVLKMLKDTKLEKIKFTKDIPSKVWIDKNGFVYKIEYDLAKGIEKTSTLNLSVYYNSIDNAKEITLDTINIKK